MNGKKIVFGLVKLVAVIGSIGGISYFSRKELNRQKDIRNRYERYYHLTNQWLINRNNNVSLEDYFTKKEIKNIAIYGMGSLCELFYNELKASENISVKCFIDKNADELYYGLDDLPVENLDSFNEDEIDAIVVTPVYDFEDIDEELEKLDISVKRISLEDIIL